ncbi:transglutaminase family protein [Pseudomonadota bacterium]
MKQYLQHSEVINWQHPSVLAQAKALRGSRVSELEIARRCFEFVRDHIQHSGDYKRDEMTCSASDVLQQGTGWCYAKSHLLAALLRANGIPAGLCYQRLTIEGDSGPHCLHGLNAVYLSELGWYRADARGNNDNIHVDFLPPEEDLAFPITHPGEADITGIWAEPMPVVVNVLNRCHGYQAVMANLPDIELW